MRGSFQIKSGDAEIEIARKLENGLSVLGLRSQENLGLMLNLLGLKPPEGALVGLDGVLIGLRTRDLLHSLLQARCRLSQVVMMIEDLHWADSVSQEVLEKIIEGETKLGLVILHTRRPEYEPPWRDQSLVTTLQLMPLPTGDIRRLVESRLGVDDLPGALVRQVTEKAEGNALFAEEILSFLVERGVLRTRAGTVEFDGDAVAAVLPASLQSKRGITSFTLVQQAYAQGYLSVVNLYLKVKYGMTPSNIDTGTLLVNKDNAAEFQPVVELGSRRLSGGFSEDGTRARLQPFRWAQPRSRSISARSERAEWSGLRK